MKAAVIGDDHHLLPLRAAHEGLAALGIETVERNHWDWDFPPGVDFAVIYGLRGQGQDIMAHYKAHGVPLVVIDHGYINRVNTPDDFDTGYFYVGVGGLAWLPDGVDGYRASRLAYSIEPRREGPVRRVLITGQVAFDSSHRMGHDELNRAYTYMAEHFKAQGCDVRFRGHPQAPEIDPGIPDDGIRSLRAALADYDLVCTINSNSGFDAILAGLPVMIMRRCHYQSCAYPWAHNLSRLTPPPIERVQALIDRLAWSQWTAAEIAEGAPFRFLAERGVIPSRI